MLFPRKSMLWSSLLLALASSATGRILEEEPSVVVRTNLESLIPFDVQLAVSGSAADININVYSLTDIVTDWMNDSFQQKSTLRDESNSTVFASVALELQQRRRSLQENSDGGINLYTASFRGVSVWERKGNNAAPVDPQLVELIQRSTFLEKVTLLNLLQAADEKDTGLGSRVIDVRAFIAPTNNNGNNNGSATDKSLQTIIIIAIVVACLAFGLLMFAVIWAWRTDQSKRDNSTGYKTSVAADRSLGKTPEGTHSESYDRESPPRLSNDEGDQRHHMPPSMLERPPEEIPTESNYPESVISEDISTSLTAYYKSGMGAYNAAPTPRRDINDAASICSMDSYGYSLDGYAPSMTGGIPLGYPATLGTAGQHPVNGQIKTVDDDDDSAYDT